MRARFSKRKTWLWLSAVAAVALLLWAPVGRVRDVAAVQNSLQRGWEISFNSGDAPANLPSFIDAGAYSLFGRIFAGTQGYDGSQSAPTRNRDIIYRERFRALFCGPIREVHIYYFEGFRGDLGAALARFPQLQRVTVFENEADYPTESEWMLLCTKLRALPHLEELTLGGAWLTDAALAPLAGHPQLRTASINYGRLTGECAKTFASMPRLTKLHIENQLFEGEVWLTPERKQAIKAALPSVNVELP